MGIITIAFDDGYAETFRQCADFLTEHGISATFAVPSSLIGKTLENRDVMNGDQVKHLLDNGHEIASHTVNHRNLLDVFNSEGEEAVKSEMRGSKEALGSMLDIEIESFVFPFIINNQSPRLRAMASDYYRSSRITTESFAFNKLPVTDPYSIAGMALTADIPMGEYDKMVEIVSRNDLWLIEVFHLVSDKNTMSAHRDEPYRFFTHIEVFKKHVQYILDHKVPVMPQKQARKSPS